MSHFSLSYFVKVSFLVRQSVNILMYYESLCCDQKSQTWTQKPQCGCFLSHINMKWASWFKNVCLWYKRTQHFYRGGKWQFCNTNQVFFSLFVVFSRQVHTHTHTHIYVVVLLDDLMRGYLRTILPTSIITSLSTEWEAFTFAAEDKLNELTKILPNPTTFCYHTIVQRYMGLVSKVCGVAFATRMSNHIFFVFFFCLFVNVVCVVLCRFWPNN